MTSVMAAPSVCDPQGALSALACGRPVVVVDDVHGRGCDLVVLAAFADVSSIATMVRHGSGLLFVTVDTDTAEHLDLPPMSWQRSPTGVGRLCVTVDAVAGTTTGISAHDRAITVATLASTDATPASFSRPGHVVPVLTGDRRETPDRATSLARIGGLAVGAPGSAPPRSVAFCALTSTFDATRIATTIEDAAALGLPVVRNSAFR
ncbi:3,4-dihydroxy-2-butanone-4-phosphate synthase [Gordonia terrae]|uniref:3,4-dihydroxy-2-butanone-4-phosphate synthase n=1 Tax=Gordonia terrae TaxID=2055 RepID=UPI00200A742E|nr:3,4-dihydroxy-2-butanone-4-phosphate synthase [Gordonia terrae]UPW09486.1 3,4-dihydroxy-2-butanone-4-phosphate synthase [Gordonia terrae]